MAEGLKTLIDSYWFGYLVFGLILLWVLGTLVLAKRCAEPRCHTCPWARSDETRRRYWRWRIRHQQLAVVVDALCVVGLLVPFLQDLRRLDQDRATAREVEA